jgi:hypothetical protein
MTLRSVELALLLLLGMLGVSVWLVVRSVQRRLRRMRTRFGGLSVVAFSWWQGAGDRHRMWRAVSGAERAVKAAVAGGAASGDLPSLVRRLRRAAENVDRLLTAAGSNASGQVAAELRQVLEMAEKIRASATEALLTVTAPATSSLAEAVATEVSALRHGLSVAALTRR